MSISVKNNGTWTLVKSVYVRQAGVWVPAQKVLEKNAGTWTQVYAAEVVATISANTNNVVVQNLFSAADWADQKKKRIEILPGVIIGSTSAGTPALRTGTGGVGEIIINNAGSIHGAGGAANSGAGGHAINVQQTGITINNSGAIRGGGGGRGGNGGPGYYYSTATEGPVYQRSGGAYYWLRTGANQDTILWAGSVILSSGYPEADPRSIGAYTYHRYAFVEYGGQDDPYPPDRYFSLYREYTVTNYTSGGGGGNGGRGQGSDGSLTGGSGGAAGGSNAGTGGTGAAGGNWGLAGGTGATGGGGNNGGGTAGAAGGAAGAAITGSARTLNNTGTINGAT
ncbi:hypothetical protein [Rhizobium sp. BK379]|uniref:hypothetical protein n=1 Tax=Rhizobium sp. BK379 TaxID=2587059 RepID=UPI0016230E12|nr:hypothetical protein [Rhizobium sp. BK379]MBB3445883.1 hypothetical protein [Rhizobium sp. BK379]